MKIVEFSLRRRVTVAMCALAIVLFGIVAFGRLRVALLPELTYPSLTIETRLPGAAPAEIEQLVTRPLEERIGVVSGAQRLSSVSRPGLSQVTVEFGWGRDMDFAAIDVREKIDALRLPDGADAPLLLRFDPAADPVMRLYLRGVDDLYALRELAEETVEKDLESAAGVAAIEVSGGYEDEIEIVVDQGRMTLAGLSMTDVATKLSSANVDQAGGSLYEREARYLVRARNRFRSLDDVRATILADVGGKRVTVGDVADVRRTHRERETITRLAGAEAVELAIFKEGDANTTAVAAAIRERLDTIREGLPEGVDLVVATDQSTFITASVDEVIQSAALGGLFAIVVLMLFLRDVRNTLIIATAIPISVVATFFLMYETGTTLNVMSLGGLALGVGMLVDSAIVVLESIHRQREAGRSPTDAALQGASEVGRAVIASTLTTVAVFLPVVFLEGIAAQLFRDMAVTVCFSLLVSLAVSLTLIPMMAATSGSATAPDARSGIVAQIVSFPIGVVRVVVGALYAVFAFVFRPLAFVFDRALQGLNARYPALLRGAVRRPATVLGIAALMFAATVLSIPRLGLDLIPAMSQGEFSFVIELPEGTPLAATDRTVDTVQSVLDDDPRVDRYASIAGRAAVARSTTATDGEHTALLQVRMAEGTTAQDEAEVIDLLRGALAASEARRIRLERPSVFTLRRPVEVELYGDDRAALREAGDRVQAQLAAIDGVVEARSSAELGHPEVQVKFDRERMAAVQVAVADVAATIRHKLQGEVSTQFREGDREVDIRLRSLGRTAATPDDVRRLIVAKRGNAPIRLDAVATVEVTTGPSEIHRRGQNRVVVVSADVRNRDMGALVGDLTQALQDLDLPAGVEARLAGQEQEMDRSLRSLLLALALAGFLVYLVMAAQFESLLHPLIVIFTLPLAAIGVVGAMLVSDSSVSVVSLIGVVMLAGIVVNNAIVLVDAINRRREDGLSKHDAIVAAGEARLRPILMTSATTVLGLLPLALATGAGAELRGALAIAVIGGLAVATLLTLVVIPVAYSLFDRKRFERSA